MNPTTQRCALRSGRAAALVPFLLALAALLGLGVGAARAQTGTGAVHVLGLGDNGTTLTIPIGDSVELKLDPSLTWSNVTVSDLTVLRRPPVLLIQGVQGLWVANAAGTATISATGSAACRAATPPCAVPDVLFTATVVVQAPGQGPGSLPSGTTHTLTGSDNGSTLTIPVGDGVSLMLSSSYNWSNVTVSNASVLRPAPVALAQGVQGLWVAAAPGSSTISATGTFKCQGGAACPLIALSFTATVVVTSGTPPPPPVQVTYTAGWNLVGVPANSTLPVDVYSWDPAAGSYSTVPAGTALQAGQGYWAYFAASTTLTLVAGTPSARVQAPAGAWVLIGNPSSQASAQVSGADVVYTWDPAAASYTASTTLPPGAGAWARSTAGGTITITAAR